MRREKPIRLSSLLTEEFSLRYSRNKSYSNRAFARDLGISPSHLSDLMSGKNGITFALCEKISAALKYSAHDQEILFAASEAEFGRTLVKKKTARAFLDRLDSEKSSSHFEVDVLATISDWYHMAILELSQLAEFTTSPKYIAKKLRIKPGLVEPAIERVVRLGLAEKIGEKIHAIQAVSLGNGPPSSAIRSFHRQVLKKALKAIDAQPTDRRFLFSNFVAVSSSDIPRAQKFVADFVTEFNREFDKSNPKEEVYCLSVQLFDICHSIGRIDK